MADVTVNEELIRRLSELLEETGLTEIEYAEGETRVRVSRAVSAAAATALPAAPAAPEPSGSAQTEAPAVENAITAPMVGTVYLAPEPGAEAFIRVGDTVAEGDTLMLIEAMKTFNPVRAAKAGKVTRILVTDGTPVEYGQPLVVLE